MESIQQLHKNHFITGLRAGIPISIGFIPIAIAFGLTAKSLNIPEYVPLLMSLIIFAGASQFIGITLLATGISHWEIIMTTFVLNFRHFLMTASLSQRLPEWTSRSLLAILSFGVTDESFSVASLQEDKKIHPSFILGLNFIAYASWNICTWIGVFLATGLPQSLQNSMGIALYSMFIGILVPSLKKSKSITIIVLLAIAISFFLWKIPLFSDMSTGWRIVITTIITSTIGAYFFPSVGEEDD